MIIIYRSQLIENNQYEKNDFTVIIQPFFISIELPYKEGIVTKVHEQSLIVSLLSYYLTWSFTQSLITIVSWCDCCSHLLSI